MKAPTISRRIWLIMSTVCVIGGLFCYYFLVYMRNREIDLEAKKFRALNQYAENIKNAYAERTKTLFKFNSPECTPKDTTECIPTEKIWKVLGSLGFRPPEKLSRVLRTKPNCVRSDSLRTFFETHIWPTERTNFLELLKIPDCVSEEALKKARIDVINPVIKQSEFSELVFEVNSMIERQTFANSLDSSVLQSILKKDNASVKREVEFQVNNENYIVFIHSFRLGESPSRIFGFCSKKEFNSQIRSVGLVYIIGASLLLILILLTMPLLKLWIMNGHERLRTTNVWFCGFSLVVGSSLLLLILLMTNDLVATYESFSRNDVRHDRNERIEVLSRKIEDNFVNELRSIFTETQESGVYYQLRGTRQNPKLYPNVFKNKDLVFRSYPYFNEILWINNDGTQDLIMANHSLNQVDVVNLSSRKYFSQPRNDSTWLLPDSESQERFALQSIHSYTTNRHEAGFGTRFTMADNKVGVLAIATKLHSVMDPILPPGYQFVVLDKTGKVWFHSITDRNLNENLFDETGRDVELIAAVEGRSTTTVDVSYDKTSHRAYIKPIRNTDLFLVVLHDNAYFTTPVVLTVGFAFALVFILFLIQGIHQLILVASTNRFSLLRVRLFFLAWIGPQKEKMNLYRTAIWIQFILLLPCAFCAFWITSLPLVVCFMTLPIMLTVYHYFSLERAYILSIQKERGTSPWKHPFLITSVLLVFLINFSSVYVFGWDESVLPSIVQLVIMTFLLTVYGVMIYMDSPFVTQVRGVYENNVRAVEQFVSLRGTVLWTFFLLPWFGVRAVIRSGKDLMIFFGLSIDRLKAFETNYYAFVFLWLILASVVPTYYFYKVGYYEEGKVWMRYLGVTAAQAEESRDIILQNELGNFGEARLKKISAMGNYLPDPFEVMTVADSQILSSDAASIVLRNTLKSLPDTIEFVEAKEKLIHKLMFKSTPKLRGLAEQSRAMIFPHAGDGRWSSFEHGLSTTLKYETNKGDTRYYLSTLLPYQTLKGDYWMLILVFIVLSTMMLYHTLRFCVTHIFGLGLLSNDRFKSPRLRDGAKFFIVGLPHSGKGELLNAIKKIKRIDDDHTQEIDLNANSIEINRDCKLVIANYFHLNVNNHESNLKKLEKLEALNKLPNLIVAVTSDLEPSTILDFYEKMANYYRNEKDDYELEGNYRKCRQAYRKWKHILSQYTTYYHPLKMQSQFDQADINTELGHGEYLPRLYKDVNKSIDTTRDSERMILQVENLSQLYYQAIWNCLSPSEKFILHDLAKDGFVNMRNMKVIRALRQKGIVILNNSLQIMNKSFNNFILSIVDEDADIKKEEEVRKKGSWNTVHLILVITIVSIIAFLGIAQQQVFKSFEAILAAITALLPLLARLGGIFSGSKSKE